MKFKRNKYKQIYTLFSNTNNIQDNINILDVYKVNADIADVNITWLFIGKTFYCIFNWVSFQQET